MGVSAGIARAAGRRRRRVVIEWRESCIVLDCDGGPLVVGDNISTGYSGTGISEVNTYSEIAEERGKLIALNPVDMIIALLAGCCQSYISQALQ